MRKNTSLVLTCLASLAAGSAWAQQRPAVVELFTSEGCNSCPPAEAYLGQLAQRPDVLALAFHVDYWDDYWQDRFVIRDATPRQRSYAKSLKVTAIYTPQMVIDGSAEFVGTDRARISQALQATRSGVPVQVAVHDDVIAIDLGPAAAAAAGDVMLLAIQRSAVTPVGRGENSGKTLNEFNIVRAVKRLGRYGGSAETFRAELGSLPKGTTDVAVLVQASGQGAIQGAARAPVPEGPL